ncbi:MAG: phage major capsid protein, partial [bacterium]|nr:phage major capsid protein [bacterium]
MKELLNAIAKIESIESQLNAFQAKAFEEIKTAGTVSKETESAIEGIGNTQRELGERLLMLEQNGMGYNGSSDQGVMSMGRQFIDSENYKAFVGGSTQKARFEIQANTSVGSDTTVAPDRKVGVVPGAFNPLRMETLYPTVPTASNAIEFTKEATFVNNAAEAAEAAAKAESDVTFSLVNMPVSTVAHWTKISKQLAADNAALAAYINTRMAYGVDRRVETQLAAGNGTAPNISGMLDTGNFTAHGYAAADIGTTLAKLVLIRKMIGDLRAAGYLPNAIVLNPADAATIDTDLLTTNAG